MKSNPKHRCCIDDSLMILQGDSDVVSMTDDQFLGRLGWGWLLTLSKLPSA